MSTGSNTKQLVRLYTDIDVDIITDTKFEVITLTLNNGIAHIDDIEDHVLVNALAEKHKTTVKHVVQLLAWRQEAKHE